MDSSGVGELIAAYTTLANRSGSVKLLQVRRRQRMSTP